MDFIKIALITGLAAVSYFLLLAWNEDYPKQSPQIEQSQEVLNQNISDLPNPVLGTAGSVKNESADLPQIENKVNSASINASDNTSYISISTPKQIVKINMLGGDIVHLSLPQYPVTIDSPDNPFVLLQNNNDIYVSQSGLIGKDGPDAESTGRPLYKSSKQSYVLTESQNELIVDLTFTSKNNVKITKQYIFSSSDYLIKVQYIIDNQSQNTWSANIFGQIKRSQFDDPSSSSGMGMSTYLGATTTTEDDAYKKIKFKDIDDGNQSHSIKGGWIGFSQHYFLGSWIPDPQQLNTFTTRRNQQGQYIMGFTSPETNVNAGSKTIIESSFWAGPKDQYRLEEVSPNLGYTIDYGKLTFIASPIFWLLTQINNIIGNFGFSIIVLTLIIKLLFSPLSAASYKSMAKMRKLAPKIQQLKDRYGDDKQKIMQEQMALWKKEKVNPLGGCLPMLLQMPVLIGIYWVLNESVELRQAPFILWYKDLSVMDPYFILPLIMGASMFLSQSMTPMTTADPMQAKVMKFMPVIFTVFFLWFPAGLVLYWLVSNVFNICQQWLVNKKVNATYASVD